MTDEQIKYMVDRFLGWRLPENFNPDAGISFERTFNNHLPQPMKYEPIGTNLFDASQAVEMVRYMVEGLPGNIERLEKVNEALVAALENASEFLHDCIGPEGEGVAAMCNQALKLAKEPA